MAGKIAHLFQRLKELQGSPPALARGTAVGVFIGFAPVMPFKALLILLLTVATRASTVAGLLVCTILCNPLTYLPLYYLAWWTGDLLLPGRASWAALRASFETMRAAPLAEALTVAAHMGVDAAVVLLVGGGAGFFESAVKDAFPQLKVTTSEAPVFANARGFWRMGA